MIQTWSFGGTRSHATKISFEVNDGHGHWHALEPVNDKLEIDYEDPQDRDWVSVSRGEEVSWYLAYNITASLKAGDQVRMHWGPDGKIPSSMAKFGALFPAQPFTIELTVLADSPQ